MLTFVIARTWQIKPIIGGLFAIDVLLPHAMQLSLVIDYDLLAVGPTFSLVDPLLISCPESLIL